MKRLLINTVFLLFTSILAAQVQSPSEFLGYEIGTEFSRHADVVRYFHHVSENSDLVTYQQYGKTNERRPLTYAVVTSETNHSNLEAIRKTNLVQTGILKDNAFAKVDPETAIVWLSYNVHGNEASSTEAAMATLYELVTSKKEYLNNTVVIIDPCVNPDGRDRYANWYNQVKSTPYDPLQIAAEHDEPWPGGRPNHYLFDLNRDWMWATQVETQQRLKIYNKWMPHIHVDFHEQGINEPYYFAPAAEPFHEVITDFQRDFQTTIGKNHAKYFDEEGWLFFTKERFDLLYPSYGDTYPIFMGAIGMTYEQAGHGRAGLGINTDEGYELTLIDRVAHHKTTGLSTVEVASQNAQTLNTEFKNYFKNDNLKYKSYVLSGDSSRLKSLAELLDKHEIIYGFATDGTATGFNYSQNKKGNLKYDSAMVVSTNQPKGKMVKVLFEPNAKLSTPLTYDITAWSLPHAYGLEAIASETLVNTTAVSPFVDNIATTGRAGYIAQWKSMQDARFLADLIKQGIRVRFTEKPFINRRKSYDRGSLILTRRDNKLNDDFDATVKKIAAKHNVQLDGTSSSFSDAGPDFGSPEVKLINPPKIALLRGDNTSSLSYGATWYFFEQTLEYPVTSVYTSSLSRTSLNQFDIIVMPSGWYNSILTEDGLKKIKDFVQNGGKIIAISNAVSSFAGKSGFSLKRKSSGSTTDEDETQTDDKLIPYGDRENASTKNFITGAIFKAKVDPTHPLAFGYPENYFTLKLGSTSYDYLDKGFNVAWIPDEITNVSGFAGESAKEKLRKSMIFGEERIGSGSIIYMVDDPLFRGFWENGKLFFANALFFTNNNKFRL
ncbi:M14 family metallopeptidase [Dokdonia sp. Hel_I_53]|uniref:M14 family metallopeptidase n=1 Tax=Dokdonia sp. Hel_I_53 TaxID=1566287 RepID=UPI00119936C2|nr:M14 family metallopeptidase [Dokdonia sp. Hel_I_53]TVZ51940.1 zinc carboxypeptidase [Dokdonia sp. Hel_I_53]